MSKEWSGCVVRDEMLKFNTIHDCVFLIEYKLKKTKIDGESVYGYVYYIYCCYPQRGDFKLCSFIKSMSDQKRNRKKCLDLISFECRKLVEDNESKMESPKNSCSEWIEKYKFLFRANIPESLVAHDIQV